MAIYKCSWEVEPGTTRIKFNEWSERVLNPGSPDLKASALTTRSLHAQPAIWEKLLSNVSHGHVDLMDAIKEGVDVEQFLTHFKGDFKGKSFDSDRPRPIVLENSRSCAQFSEFISTTILQWVSAGILSVWGEIGQVSPPYLVLPLTVEPSKPRLCYDERYINL